MLQVPLDRSGHVDVAGRGVGGQAGAGVQVGHGAEAVVGVAGGFEATQRDVVTVLAAIRDVQRRDGTEPDEQAHQDRAESVLLGGGQAGPGRCGRSRRGAGERLGDPHGLLDRREELGVDLAKVVGDGGQGGKQGPAGCRDVDPGETQWNPGCGVVPAHPAQGLVDPHRDRVGEMGRQIIVPALALGPGVQRESFAEAVLEGQDGETTAFRQEPQDALAHERELGDEVGALADRDDARVADDVAQRLQVVERRLTVEVGERDGMGAKLVGECGVVGRSRHADGSILVLEGE